MKAIHELSMPHITATEAGQELSMFSQLLHDPGLLHIQVHLILHGLILCSTFQVRLCLMVQVRHHAMIQAHFPFMGLALQPSP